MTTPPGPPPGPPPDEDPQGYPPTYDYDAPPPVYPPPAGYPPPGYLPPPPGYLPPPHRPEPKISIGMVFVGPVLYAGINLVIGFAAFIGGGMIDDGRGSPNLVFGFTAVLLAAIAFGGGALMLRSKSPYAKGLGIGLMVGWALVSLFTAGFCTGINPEMYQT
ncbi:hypothetical protein [Mycolicibacterium sp.]|uniref:hypothetical protein n=1 Tax=Mycolicibacterium sp. TaxID=2320850 RepID=UPI0037CCBB86